MSLPVLPGDFFYCMKNPPLSLLKQCRQNDRKAHFALYEWCFQDLINITRQYFKNEDDIRSIVNTSFLNMIKGLELITKNYDDALFYSWMRKITLRCIIDEFRKQKKYLEKIQLEEEQDIIKKYEGISDNGFDKYEKEAIQNSIDALPEMSRAVFNLYAIEGYKHEEIGEMLNISANTSKVHLFKARQKLQLSLQKQKIGSHD